MHKMHKMKYPLLSPLMVALCAGCTSLLDTDQVVGDDPLGAPVAGEGVGQGAGEVAGTAGEGAGEVGGSGAGELAGTAGPLAGTAGPLAGSSAGGDDLDGGEGLSDMGVAGDAASDLAPPPEPERYALGACAPDWGAWIHHTHTLNPLNTNDTRELTPRLLAQLDCVARDGELYALFTDLAQREVAERLVAAAQAGVSVRVLLVRPSEEVEALLTRHLGAQVSVCAPEGCAPSAGGQGANLVLMSRTTVLENGALAERPGAVVHLNASFGPPEFVVGPSLPAWSEMISRYGDEAFYLSALDSYQAISEGRRAPRALSEHLVNGSMHLLQTSLDLHGAAHSPRGIFAELGRCVYRDDVSANVWLAAPRLTGAQLWMLDEITRLENNGCSVKVLANELSADIAAALGGRARLTDFKLNLSLMTAVVHHVSDDKRYESAWSAPAGWLSAEGEYEGGALWMWNEAEMDAYRAPLLALWDAGRAP